jgi:hypothetical protein
VTDVDKTLGQVAFEAHIDAWDDELAAGQELDWRIQYKNDPAHQAAWQAAADAVVVAAHKRAIADASRITSERRTATASEDERIGFVPEVEP